MTSLLNPEFAVVWPKSPRGTQGRVPAARLQSLNGKRIAFLWDYMFRGEELFPVLETHLRDRFNVDVVGYDTFGNIHGPDEKLVVSSLATTLAAQRIDAVVVGNGC